MTLKFINNFQNKIYTELKSDPEILKYIKNIHIGSKLEIKYPALIINITKAENKTIANHSVYAVDFTISAYARDANHANLFKISDLIIYKLAKMNKKFDGHIISGIQATDLKFEKAKDLVLNKVIIDYKSYIRQEIK